MKEDRDCVSTREGILFILQREMGDLEGDKDGTTLRGDIISDQAVQEYVLKVLCLRNFLFLSH